jgi:16S rRNA (guanine527-N7)-methyltransferase
MSLSEIVSEGLSRIGVAYEIPLIEKSLAYLDLITKWNRVTNLTSVTEPEEMIRLHLIDSFAVSPHLTGQSLLDVGSGAGLPGIPLALMNPDKDFILLDSNGKKTRFMTQAVIELGLGNVEVVQARAQEFDGTVDHVICRAFRSLEDFTSACGHIRTTSLLAMKGPDGPEEAGVFSNPAWQVVTHTLGVPGAERYLVELTRQQHA